MIPKAHVAHLLQPRTREHYDHFTQCPECGRVYWRGSHYSRMRHFLDVAFAAASPDVAHGCRQR